MHRPLWNALLQKTGTMEKEKELKELQGVGLHQVHAASKADEGKPLHDHHDCMVNNDLLGLLRRRRLTRSGEFPTEWDLLATKPLSMLTYRLSTVQLNRSLRCVASRRWSEQCECSVNLSTSINFQRGWCLKTARALAFIWAMW